MDSGNLEILLLACEAINTAISKYDAAQANIHAEFNDYSLQIAYSRAFRGYLYFLILKISIN